MIKKVKGGILKHYCACCGKLLYDEIPKEPTVKALGQFIPEYSIKRYCCFKVEFGNKKKGIQAGDYCKECHDKMFSE